MTYEHHTRTPLSLSLFVCVVSCLLFSCHRHNSVGQRGSGDLSSLGKHSHERPSQSTHGSQLLKSDRLLEAEISVHLFLDLSIQQRLVETHFALPTTVSDPLSDLLTDTPSHPRHSPLRPRVSPINESLYPVSGPIHQLIQNVNRIYQSQKLKLVVRGVHSWESTENGLVIDLSQLARRLTRTTQRVSTLSKSTQPTIYIGLVSTPPPSFAHLDDLRWASRGSPIIVIRNPQSFYGGAEMPALTASARLITQALAIALGAGPSCEQGWSNARRDILLGLRPSTRIMVESSPTSPSSRRAPVRGATARDTLSAQEPEVLWDFKEIPWSQFGVRVFRRVYDKIIHGQRLWHASIADSCQDFTSLRQHCKRASPLQKSLAHHCFNREEQLINAHQRGLLNTPEWSDERESALGWIDLQAGADQKAFDRCATVARHHPSMLASKCAGFAAERLMKWSEAALYLRAYLASHPHDVPTHSALARILGSQGADRDAVSLLRELVNQHIDLGDERGRIFLNLGIGEARLGRWKAAVQSWTQIQPQEAEYNKAQELLRAFAQGKSSPRVDP